MAYEIKILIGEQVQTDGISRDGTSQDADTTKYQKQLSKYVASQTIQPFIQEVKSQVTQNIGIITGNTELQQRVNFGMSLAQQGASAYRNAQAGGIITAGLGLGAGIGAGIGLALTAINTTMNIMFNRMNIDRKENLENRQINETLSRYGASYNKSRSGL